MAPRTPVKLPKNYEPLIQYTLARKLSSCVFYAYASHLALKRWICHSREKYLTSNSKTTEGSLTHFEKPCFVTWFEIWLRQTRLILVLMDNVSCLSLLCSATFGISQIKESAACQKWLEWFLRSWPVLMCDLIITNVY